MRLPWHAGAELNATATHPGRRPGLARIPGPDEGVDRAPAILADPRPAGLVDEIGRSYARHVKGRPLEPSILATVAYFTTLSLVRAFTIAARGSIQPGQIDIAGVHVHHLVFGVMALLAAGVLALDEVFRRARAVLFGFGAALVLDEFALLVFLRDVYWLPQGTLSIAALVIGLAGLAINAWRGRQFLLELVTGTRARR